MIRHAIQMTVLIIYGLERDNLKNNQVLTLEWNFFFEKVTNLLRPVKTSPFKRTNNVYYRKLARPYTVKKKRKYQIIF